MFRKRIGIDLGTANTVFVVNGTEIVLDQPSVVALQTTKGRTRVIAVGEAASPMLGKTPQSIEAYTPLREGVIANFDIAEKMIDAFFKIAVPVTKFFKPVVIVCVPFGATAVEKRAIQQSILAAGAKRVGLIEEPMAAAMGAGLPVSSPKGSMIVDIGGGTTEIAIISLGGIVCASSIRIGGNHYDRVIADTVRKNLELIIGTSTAERIKFEVVTAAESFEDQQTSFRSFVVNGIGSRNGTPKAVTVNSDHFTSAMLNLTSILETEIRSVLEKSPPDLAADVYLDGITLTGGGALLRGLADVLSKRLGITVSIAESPKYSVAFGTGLAAQMEKKFQHCIQYEI
jgi:rod shape-determining protein MreB